MSDKGEYRDVIYGSGGHKVAKVNTHVSEGTVYGEIDCACGRKMPLQMSEKFFPEGGFLSFFCNGDRCGKIYAVGRNPETGDYKVVLQTPAALNAF
jgi:hypothetical protein